MVEMPIITHTDTLRILMTKHLGWIAPSSVFSKLFSGFLTGPVPVLDDRGAKSSGADTSSEQRLLPARRTWVSALLIWAAACVFHLAIFLVAHEQHKNNHLVGASRRGDLLGFLSKWDADLYERIYTNWYPQHLPMRPDGTVDNNTWAFMPLQPLIAGGVADTFGIGYRVAALALTIVAGFTLAYVLHRLFIGCLNWRDRGIFDTRALVGDESRNRLALWAVAVYAFSMASPVFITGYAEALSVLLIALSVWCRTPRPIPHAAPSSAPRRTIPPGRRTPRCLCWSVVAVVYGERLPSPSYRGCIALCTVRCVGLLPGQVRAAYKRVVRLFLRVRTPSTCCSANRAYGRIFCDGAGME